jgi:hypothetical protein
VNRKKYNKKKSKSRKMDYKIKISLFNVLRVVEENLIERLYKNTLKPVN